MARLHAWTYEEDFICCMEYLEFVFNYTGDDKTKNLVEKLKRQLPHISAGSLRMKAQNIKYIAMESGLEDRLSISPLSQCSEQCKKAFADAVEKFNPSVIKHDTPTTQTDVVVLSSHPDEDFDCFPIGAWEMEPGFTLVGERVAHVLFGTGVVADYDPDGGLIKINFDQIERKFKYPDAFEKFLKFENSEYQLHILKYLRVTAFHRNKKRKKKNSGLRYDSIEDSFYYIKIEDELERLIVKKIGKGGYLGYCHMYWTTKKEILKDRYGIDWKSPAELNPHVMFD